MTPSNAKSKSADGPVGPLGKQILVTGGAGFIGSHVVDALIENNKVTVFDDLSSGRFENIEHLKGHPNFRFIEGSILDRTALKSAFDGMDMVFHLAVQCIRLSIANPIANHDVNATGSLYVCEAAHQANVKRLIYVSSSEVYGTALDRYMSESDPCYPTTVYGAAKLAGEGYAGAYHRTYGLESIIVRPFNTYGPREHHEGALGEVIPKFIIRIANGKAPIIQGDGEQTRDFTYVSDTARGILLASMCDQLVGKTVNIGAGKEQSIRRIAEIIAEVMESDIRPIHQPARPGDVRRHQADISRAREFLNFTPRIEIDDGIRTQLKWLKTKYDLTTLGAEDQEKNWVPR